MKKTSPRLIASYFTLAGNIIPFASSAPSPIPLEYRARAAANAGYVGIGLDVNDLSHCVDLYGYKGIRRILAESGLEYLELEVLTDWFANGERFLNFSKTLHLMLQAVNELPIVHLKAVGDAILEGDTSAKAESWSIERMINSFGELCQKAAAADTSIVLELYPGSNVRDIDTARRIVEGANQDNGGLLIDIWHLARGGIPYRKIEEIPLRFIKHIELDDASANQIGTIFEDTVLRRKLPGEGNLDVPAFLKCVRKTGYAGLYGVEIVSEQQRKLSVEEAATMSFRATMDQFHLI
jgi:sugar phosphate isomerase/epimerase